MNICHDELRPPNYDSNLIETEIGSILSDDKAIMGLRGLVELGSQFAGDLLLTNQIRQNSLSGYNITTNYCVCSRSIRLESGWQQNWLKTENGIITKMD